MEQKRIYALCGTSNSGKTSILNALIDIFLKKAEEKILLEKVSEDVSEDVSEKDRIAIFLINGVHVGISTHGDSAAKVESCLDRLEKNCNINIIFCAARTRGGTRTHLVERFGDQLPWIKKMGIYNHKAYAFDNSAFIEAKTQSLANLMSTLAM